MRRQMAIVIDASGSMYHPACAAGVEEERGGARRMR